MTLNYKYTILYTFVSLFLFWFVINVSSSICNNYKMIEGITNNNINSSLYSHTVNLPINDPISCKNFCGPKSQCAITREQCTSDIDCYGCKSVSTKESECLEKDVKPYDATGKLGQNQGLQYSSLTTGFNNHNINFSEVYSGSKNAEIVPSYKGASSWTQSFNSGIKLYNDKRASYDKYSSYLIDYEEPDIAPSKMSYYEPKYPTTVSVTGQFYQTMPPASNSAIQ